MSKELGLGYWLAQTQFSVTVVKRNELERRGKETFVRAVVDVAVKPSVEADPTGRQRLDLDSALLSDLSLTIDLDERGLLESISTDPDRISPRTVGPNELVPDPPSVAVTCNISAKGTPPSLSLEQQWSRNHEHLVGHAAQIETNIERLLNNLGHFDANPVVIAQSGQALEVLQAQLEAIGRAKQDWMATPAGEHQRAVWHLTTADLVRVDNEELPLSLAHAELSASLTEMAERFDVLVLMADGERPETRATPARHQSALALRRSRPAKIGVYVRSEIGDWDLQDGSVLALDVVDGFSRLDLIPLDGSWLRSTSFNLVFHADMSLKTFGTRSPGRSRSAASNGAATRPAASDKPRARPRKATESPAPEATPALVEQRNQTNQPPDLG